MTIGSKFAILVMAVTSLIVSGILVAAVSIPTIAQKSPGSLSGGDVTSFLQSAKMHLTEATKIIKMDNSKAALMQINMTRQAITLAGLKLNATIICNNIRNEGYCVAP
ncbi:MAG TPA: hypothetical protein VEL11_16465 [Candidatus Bathyarchaeia archaeon]|nr:hypothetical protein [Candidatus Bathyarchaeia archaeon]